MRVLRRSSGAGKLLRGQGHRQDGRVSLRSDPATRFLLITPGSGSSTSSLSLFGSPPANSSGPRRGMTEQSVPSAVFQDEHALQAPSPLLQLPGELRNQILRYVVTQPEPIALRRARSPFSIDLSILSCCRQLRDEATGFLYQENVFEVEVDSHGLVTSLHFSKHHLICEYRAEEAVAEISKVFLEKFARFQFRFRDTRTPDSLRGAIKRIAPRLSNKHLTIILPPPRDHRRMPTAGTTRPRAYPNIVNPLSPFSLLRCASLAVIEDHANYAKSQHEKLIDLVTSGRPSIDMTQQYNDLQRSARAVDRMLMPPVHSLGDYELLRQALFEHMHESCEHANRSDQDAFLQAVGRFEDCYRQMQELQ